MKSKYYNSSLAQKVVSGLNHSVCNLFAVKYAKEQLRAAGFNELNPQNSWTLQTSGRYFFTKNETSLFAFSVGSDIAPRNTTFRIIGTHTDSPNLRLSPNAYFERDGYQQLHLQTYGGGKWETFFDRDLSLAGKLVVKGRYGKAYTQLIKIDDPILHIPHLCIHLSSTRNKFEWNNEKHLNAVLSASTPVKVDNPTQIEKRLGTELANLVAEKAKVSLESILDFDLQVYDTQKSQITGLNKEFISSGRLDNLASSLVGLESLIETTPDNENSVNILAMFDSEEIGSNTVNGAASNVLYKTLRRIFHNLAPNGTLGEWQAMLHKSLACSADMAHAVHPNYSDKHQSLHKPRMHEGVVIKTNANGRYTTDCESAAFVRLMAEAGDFKVQDFVIRQDGGCGSTIGPMMSVSTGIRCFDVGLPQLAMHSVKELGSVEDLEHYRRLFNTFYLRYDELKGDLFKI